VIRPHLGPGTRWLVVGGSFIGAEFAASAALTGSEVELVMLEQVLLENAFGATVGGWFDERLRGHGVSVHPGRTVRSIEPTADGLRALLDDGSTLTADRVVVGAGVVPSTQLAEAAGLALELGGIAVDARLRTSAPDVYAIGDVAAYESVLHGRRVRIEHWDVARAHGVYLAQQLAHGASEPYDVLPYFFGTLGNWAYLEYVGRDHGTAVMRGATDGADMSAAFLDEDGTLTGLIAVARPDDLEAARPLVLEHARLDAASLADGDRPLAECRLPRALAAE
jgi:pyruvate/2-oxoglutarate dehydrogenase complex dihydrolipoamide dehydrogenase (E3) component